MVTLVAASNNVIAIRQSNVHVGGNGLSRLSLAQAARCLAATLDGLTFNTP